MISPRRLWTLAFIFSAFTLTASVLFLVIFPSIYRYEIAKKTNIVQDSFLYPIWRDLPLPIYKRLYFFNITNAEEFLQNGTKMEVNEVGPYTYVGRWIKEDIQWNPEGTVSYREVKTFHFVREESVGSEEDMIYSLNGPYIVAADYLKDLISSVRKGANKIFRLFGEELIIKRTIKDLAFGGYKDPIMRFGKLFRPDVPFKNGKFSWLTGHNATDDGMFEVSTGKLNHSLLNMIKKWNGDSYLDFWKNDTCNKIRGTNAEFSPPLRKDQTEYTFFQPIFCRAVTFRGNSTVIHKGIKTKKFENNEDIFSKSNPDNICFDIDPDLASGVLDVSPCQFEAPVVLSFPHFYLADESYLKHIKGLEPNKENHGSHIDVEILTGVTVDLSIKIQMNVKLEPVEHLTAFENATSGVYPIFWLDLSVTLPNDLIDTIHSKLLRPKKIVVGLVTFVIALSLIFLIATLWKKRTELYWELCFRESKSELEWDSFYNERQSLLDSNSYLLNSHTGNRTPNENFDSHDSKELPDIIIMLKNSYNHNTSETYEEDANSFVEMAHMKIPNRSSKSNKNYSPL